MRKHGIIYVKVDGSILEFTGDCEYNLGTPKQESKMGANGKPVGIVRTPQPPMIKGTMVIQEETDLVKLTNLSGATVTLEMDGETAVLSDAFYTGEGTAHTESGEFEAAFEGKELNLI